MGVRIVLIAAALLIIAAAAGAAWFFTGHGFSARARPSAFEAFLATHARSIATPRGAKDRRNPLQPTPLAIAEARDHFADHCATCHGNDGAGKTEVNAGLFPPAPDLTRADTQTLSDGELFYIIRNGVRFTGMPGWDGADEDNWELVLFIRHLPRITPRELELMKEANGLETHSREESGRQ